MELGKVRTTTGGSELLDFELMNERGARVRVTLWAPLCNEIKRKGCAVDPYVVILLPAMNVKEFRGDLFLCSTSAAVLFDAPDIPQISSLSAILKKNGAATSHAKRPSPAIFNGSIYQLLRTGREQNGTRKKPVTYNCKGRVLNIQTKDSFIFHAGLADAKKKVSRFGTKFMCQACNKVCEFPRTSYRLHLTIADPTGSVVVTLFDDVATKLLGKTAAQLLVEVEDDDAETVIPPTILALTGTSLAFEIKSSSYYNQGSYESFTVTSVTSLPVDKLLSLKRAHTEMDDTGASETIEEVVKHLGNEQNVNPPLTSVECGEGSVRDGEDVE